MNPSDPQTGLDCDDMTGGSEKDPDSQKHGTAEREHRRSSSAERHSEPSSEPTDAPTEGRSSSEQAALNQERALESGEEAPG